MSAAAPDAQQQQLLLDTHALLWWLAEPERLSPPAYAAIAETSNHVFVSAASAWELATKVRLGKLSVAEPLLNDLPVLLSNQGFTLLPVTFSDGLRAGSYPQAHRDPFDRLLAAQAELQHLALVSVDPALQLFPCRLLW